MINFRIVYEEDDESMDMVRFSVNDFMVDYQTDIDTLGMLLSQDEWSAIWPQVHHDSDVWPGAPFVQGRYNSISVNQGAKPWPSDSFQVLYDSERNTSIGYAEFRRMLGAKCEEGFDTLVVRWGNIFDLGHH